MLIKPIKIEEIPFDELKKYLDKRLFAIPDIQRNFVWNKKKVILLLDSIRKHYPIGSFLICKIPSWKVKRIREGVLLPDFDKKNKYCYVVVDGQQRLSVVYSLLYGKIIKTNSFFRDIDPKMICLSSSKRTELAFEFFNKNMKNPVKLFDVLNGRDNSRISKGRRKKIIQCKKSFEKYSFPFIFIDDYDDQELKKAFYRLNTGGTNLSTVDKFYTEAYHKDVDLRRHCDNLIEHDFKHGFEEINGIFVVRAIAANSEVKDFFGTKLSSFAKEISKPRNNTHKIYKKNRKKIFESLRKSHDFLLDIFPDASYIPYPAMLSILSIFFYNNDNFSPTPPQMNELMKWFWVTGFTQRYVGEKQRDNQLNDANEMKKLAKHSKYKINLEGKIEQSKLSIDKLISKPYNKRGAVRNSFFCYLLSKEPREFTNGQKMSIGKDVASLFNSKNDHHIFPKKILQDEGYNLDYINQLGNICFLTFNENVRKIRSSPPWNYLTEFIKNKNFRKVLASHIIPHNSCVLTKGNVSDKYKKFLDIRYNKIKNDLTRMMGKKYVID